MKSFLKISFLLLLMMLVLMLLIACEGSVGNSDYKIEYEYRNNVRVTYTRDISKIRFPQGMEPPYLFGRVFHPFASSPGGYEEMKSVKMEKIAENRFQGFIDRIFIQRPGDPPHIVWIDDLKMYDGINKCSSQVGEGIEIEGSYANQVVAINCPVSASNLKFKISKPASF